jgi:carnitine O-acetyltransferase
MSKSLNESLAEPGKQQPKNSSDKGRSVEQAKKIEDGFSKSEKDPLGSDKPDFKQGITFAAQEKLPKLPIPDLENSMRRYLKALKPLQGGREHAETQQAVEEFLKGEGPELQEKLKKYASGKTSYIEQFCMCSILGFGFLY